MTKKTRNWFLAICIIVLPFLIFFGCLISDLLFPPLPPIQPLPNPNGYDDFVKAGQMLASNSWDYDEMSQQELQVLVENNSNALQLARSGLKLQSRVPLKFSPIDPDLNKRLASLKRLAQAFVAEGKLAEMENRPSDAAKSYLDVIHLGNESARGGALIDELVGMAIEEIATSHLQKIVGQLDAKSCRETAATLEIFDSQRQTWSEVMQQENDWSRRTFTGIRQKIARLASHKSLEKTFQGIEPKFEQQQMRTRQLIIDLAARAYKLDKGQPPARISDLVPDYLKAIPQDPFTRTDMVYSPR